MMKLPLIFKLKFGLLLCSSLLLSCSKVEDIRVLKMAHSLPTEHPVHIAMEYMAERLLAISEGNMRMDIYSGGQLGGERETMELVQIGSLAMTKVSTGSMEGFVPEMKVFGVPYVFKGEEHFWEVLEGEIGKELLLKGERVRLRGLGYYDAGSRSFYTVDEPVHTPADLQGKKIRVMKSQTAVEMVSALGGSGTPISWGELYTALQQGVVDGAENNPPSFYTSKHFEVAKYYTLDEHTFLPDVVLISTYVWNSLTEQEQQWLQRAMDESVFYQKKIWAEASDHALEEVQKAGVTVIRPDKTTFSSRVKSMHENMQATPAYEFIQRIQAM